jgi:hypothetical protein
MRAKPPGPRVGGPSASSRQGGKETQGGKTLTTRARFTVSAGRPLAVEWSWKDRRRRRRHGLGMGRDGMASGARALALWWWLGIGVQGEFGCGLGAVCEELAGSHFLVRVGGEALLIRIRVSI